MTKAIYAFSGDPITYGHVNVVVRAAMMFESLLVAIGVNPNKDYTFSLKEREEMARDALKNIQNVEVVSFKGLLVDFAYEQGVSVVVKGLRDETDFEYESVLHQAGRSQELGIDTIFLPSYPELAHISSSMVKAIQKEHGQVHKYVPFNVKHELERKLSAQIIIGMTGEIGTGKSYIADKLVEIGKDKGHDVSNIELDGIGHQILEQLTEPKYQQARDKIIKTFGVQVRATGGMINRQKLGEAAFKSEAKLNKLNEIMHDLILVRLRKELVGKKGLVILTAALFAETNMNYLFNNYCILLDTKESIQRTRLQNRGYTTEQIKTRLNSQYSFDKKKQILQENIANDGFGKLWVFENNDAELDSIKTLYENIAKDLEL